MSTVKYTYFGKGYVEPLSAYITNCVNSSEATGSVEIADDKAGNTAQAMGDLVEILHTKGILDVDDVRKLTEMSINKLVEII